MLQTPEHKSSGRGTKKNTTTLQKPTAERRSPRLKNSGKHNKPVMTMAQELIAKKWGITQPDQDLDSLTLQQYLDKYKKPLDKESIEAIKTLSEVTTAKKKRKRTKGVVTTVQATCAKKEGQKEQDCSWQ